MKFSLVAILAVFGATANATAIARDGSTSLYVPSRDITCSPTSDGGTYCVKGHIDNAPSIEDLDLSLLTRDLHDSTPAERALTGLDKRLSCVQETLCWTHCFAIGYCNAYCDKGVCHCKCMDKTPWYKVVPCITTSCNS